MRSGFPRSCQYRRAIFVAVSIESDPPLVRNTFGCPGPARASSTRSASCDGRTVGGRRTWSTREARASARPPPRRSPADRSRRCVPQAGGGVEVPAARFVPDVDAVSTRQDQLAVRRDRRHVGERMPEVTHGPEATSGPDGSRRTDRRPARGRSVGVVRQVRAEPALGLGDALALTARVVLDLVLRRSARR